MNDGSLPRGRKHAGDCHQQLLGFHWQDANRQEHLQWHEKIEAKALDASSCKRAGTDSHETRHYKFCLICIRLLQPLGLEEMPPTSFEL